MNDDLVPTGLQNAFSGTRVQRLREWLVVTFPEPQQTLSWAVVGSGKNSAQRVVWRQVVDGELNCPVDPADFLVEQLKKENLTDAIGLLTSARLDNYVHVKKEFGQYRADCIATVGMGNALCVGDFPTAPNHVGTINLLCQLSVPLSDGAFIEAVSVATEARTKAVLESNILSRRSTHLATGTGTDCIVIASPSGESESKYSGKHTIIGHLIGNSVYEAVKSGLSRWKNKQKDHQHAG